MRRLAPVLALSGLALALGLAGCESYTTPNRPLPPLSGAYLDGTLLSSSDLAGKPWVVNLWVPG